MERERERIVEAQELVGATCHVIYPSFFFFVIEILLRI
jgi:hypothetical protein